MSHATDTPRQNGASPCVQVVMATYNGARYLPEQLDSVLNQTQGEHLQLLVSDDGSTDATLAVLADYRQRYGERISLLPPGPRLGAKANFDRLLQASVAPYVMLADQDDIWDLDKFQLTFAAMQRLEQQWGASTPCMVFTDLRVVSQAGHGLADSFWVYQHADPHRSSWQEMPLQNVATGCTMMLNRATLQLALPIPSEAIMHDWWLALVVAFCGKAAIINSSTVAYRQHSNNQIGAKGWTVPYMGRKALTLLSRDQVSALLYALCAQTQALTKALNNHLTHCQRSYLHQMSALAFYPVSVRLVIARRHGFRKQGTLRTLGWYWVLMWARRCSPRHHLPK